MKDVVAFVSAVDDGLGMKSLKRKFRMTKGDIDFNLKFLPYFRALMQAPKEISNIRRDISLSVEEKSLGILEIRQSLIKLWEKINGQI